MSQIVILVTELQRHTSAVALIQRGGAVEKTKELFRELGTNEKQEVFNLWIKEMLIRLDSKYDHKEILRTILNLVEDVLYYNQELNRNDAIQQCKEKNSLFSREVQHSLENPVWQMF